MDNSHYFVFDIDPIPKNSDKKNKYGFQYTPSHIKSYMKDIAIIAKEIWGARKLIDAPIKAELVFYIARPRSIKNRKYPHKKPDLDNLEKGFWDSLEGIVFTNDSRIVTKTVSKQYSHEGRIELKLRVLR